LPTVTQVNPLVDEVERIVLIPKTAPGKEAVVGPETGKKWRIIRGCILLHTDGTVLDRNLDVGVKNSDVPLPAALFYHWIAELTPVPASSNAVLSFGEVGNVGGTVPPTLGTPSPDCGYFGIKPIIIGERDKFIVYCNAGGAGDYVYGYIWVMES
jgi:hypothetical protein